MSDKDNGVVPDWYLKNDWQEKLFVFVMVILPPIVGYVWIMWLLYSSSHAEI